MRYICKKALFLTAIAAAAALFSGCGGIRSLDEKGITDYLEKCYGGEYEIVGQKKQMGRNYGGEMTVYSLKGSEGIEFTVEEELFQGIYGGHYEYTDDYLVQWLYERPNLYSELDGTKLQWEKSGEGFTITPRSFEETAPAAELACNIVNRCGGVVPNVGYRDERVVFCHTAPGIHINGAEGNSEPVELYGGTVDYLPEGSTESYDSSEVTFYFEQAYVDNVRYKKISEELSDEVLNSYPPEELEMESRGLYGETLYRLDNDNWCKIPYDIGETVYWTSDYCDASEKIDGEYVEQPPEFERLVTWANAGGYDTADSGIGYYTLSDGKSRVTFCFSSAGECYVTKDGERVGLRGQVYYNERNDYIAALTTEDLERLFGLQFEFDYINGKAKVKNNYIK